MEELKAWLEIARQVRDTCENVDVFDQLITAYEERFTTHLVLKTEQGG